MAASSPEVFDLEVKSKDGSWHPCRISLSEDKLDIVVHFESGAEKDIITDEKNALARLRYRSVALERGACSSIKEGEHVLAEHGALSESLLFDAVVEKIRKVKHTKRGYCKCSFEIKWLNPEMKEETTAVSSSSIRSLSEKAITDHSVLDVFLNPLNPEISAEVSSTCSLLDETIWDLVEKIQETSKSTNKSKECVGDTFLKAKRDKFSEDALNKAASRPQNLRRSTRSHNKQEVRTEVGKQSEDKLFTSPLAACAALASYIHGVAPEREVSISHIGKESYVNPLLNDVKKHKKEQSLHVANILVKSDACIQDDVSVLSIPTQMAGRRLSRSPFSSRRDFKKSQSVDSLQSSTMQELSALASRVSDGKLSSPAITENKVIPVTDGKLYGHAVTRRITRSVVQKESIDSTAEAAQRLLNAKRVSPVNTTWLTRSANGRETSNLTESSQDKGATGKLNSPTIMEHMTNLGTDDRLKYQAITKRKTRSSAQKEVIDSTNEMAQGSSEAKQNSPNNSTRSTCHAKRKEASEPSIKQELGKSRATESSQDISVEVLVTPEKNESKKKKLTSSPVHTDMLLTPDTKKMATSVVVTVAKEGQGEIMQNTGCFSNLKKKATSAKKPDIQFSSQPRYRPRTRSQK